MSIKPEIRPLAYALADAIGTDFSTGIQGKNPLAGSRKAMLELFEGYSPTVISGIDNSLCDSNNNVLAVDQHIFGNVGAITIVEGQQSTIHCFIYDRSKRPDNSNCTPWDNFWSRKSLYRYLEIVGCKAIYHRSIFDTEWQQLPAAGTRLKEYNEARDRGDKSREAYNTMWEV